MQLQKSLVLHTVHTHSVWQRCCGQYYSPCPGAPCLLLLCAHWCLFGSCLCRVSVRTAVPLCSPASAGQPICLASRCILPGPQYSSQQQQQHAPWWV